MRITYIGGPTAIAEMGGLRFITDPTFDPGGSEYKTPVYTLRKTQGPALDVGAIGHIDAVLLSHDHHLDNLDNSGNTMLKDAGKVLTTEDGAGRLGGNAVGLKPWDSIDLKSSDGRVIRVTGTPARHGPPDGDRGPVIGFILSSADDPDNAVYISGDTVWYEGVAEVAKRFPIRLAVLFMGAARVAVAGPANLTFTAEEGIQAAHAFPDAVIVPLHYEGWTHFTESRAEIDAAFSKAGLEGRLRWLEPGRVTDIP